MEVILLEDVKSLGKKGEVVKVNDGYARNFILPKKLGVEKTDKAMHELKLQKAAEAKRQQEILEEAQALAKSIEAGSITLKIKAGEGGRTFGSVSTKEIAVALKEQLKLEVDKKKLQLADPIRNFGTYHVPVRLHPKVTAEITVKVEQA
ncbi:MAG: 50S ribosomal protein L9 [Lachnospiraceae bacterium]|nr:50S ribosomal protein L9 [Lachnospiraceae bacterium]MBP3609804.1 50S ribosomal protein L9 [Lachnospiraceae bacterium]